MTELLIKVLTLDLTAVISPILFGLVVFLLSVKNQPRQKALAVFWGALLVGILITVIGFLTGNATSGVHAQSKVAGIIDLALGLLFIGYGFKQLFGHPSRSRKHKEIGVRACFMTGVLLAIFNDSFFLIFAAAKEVGNSNANVLERAVFLLINVFFFTLPIIIPIAISRLWPEKSKTILDKINLFLTNYGNLITLVLFMTFGIYFVIKGLGILA